MKIGTKINILRKERGMTLTELSNKSGVQIATLSRIENGKMTGTLDSHMAIARTLGLEIIDLYKDLKLDDKEPDTTEREPESAESFLYNDKASYEILTTQIFSKRMMPIVLRVEPGGVTNPEQNRPRSEKFLFVLEGNITVHVGEQAYPLCPNQTLYFDASVKHRFENSGEVTTRLISVTTPVEL
ncbi:MAG: helix-turn-helix transcriptional regulator [Candidatus Omnitrophica bacterium]|nr:helix-turn-helix transcriptional regulator [Candidatus Omnitrophota bacterium]